MKVKDILWGIFYVVCIVGGTLLCCFAQPLKSRWFNVTPMGIMLIIMGFLCCTFSFIEYIVDKIKDDKDKKD